ncbi:MAG: RnfABCDGE type electron transport complex subunit B [Pseudomonadota bacterium]
MPSPHASNAVEPGAGLAARIDAVLPQTQCTRCAYPDCAAYAQAIAVGEADINRCPPGGDAGIERLARITGRAVLPLDAACGSEGPRRLAVIDEAWCIGCTLCLDACPTDAILGRSKRMHTVIAPHCTGCELCIPVCPVDCIALEDATPGRTGWAAWSQEQAYQALRRYRLRTERLEKSGARPVDMEADGPASASAEAAPALAPAEAAAPAAEPDRKKATIEAALARARAARAPKG